MLKYLWLQTRSFPFLSYSPSPDRTMYDVGMIRAMLEAAGDLAMDHFLNVSPSWKADRTYVTEADLAVQAFLKEALETHFPEDGLVAEEDDLRKKPVSGDRYWIVDPIDGTYPFVTGLLGWGVALGLVEGGRPAAGFFWMPPSRDFYHTTPDGGACRNGRPFTMKAPGPLNRQTLLFTHTRPHQRYTLSADYPGRVFCLGSASTHLCHVATGSGDAVLIGHDKIWDLAPGLALLVNNGGVLRYLKGGEVTLSDLLSGTPAPYPMLGGHPDVIAQIEPLLDYHSPRFPW